MGDFHSPSFICFYVLVEIDFWCWEKRPALFNNQEIMCIEMNNSSF